MSTTSPDNDHLRQVYAHVLEASRRRGDLKNGAHGRLDRRRHPRLRVRTNDFWLSSVPEFAVLDISVSGIAFSANYPLRVGERLRIGFDGDDEQIDAVVVGCVLVESPTQYSDAEFRIHCAFVDEGDGMALLVRSKQRDLGEQVH